MVIVRLPAASSHVIYFRFRPILRPLRKSLTLSHNTRVSLSLPLSLSLSLARALSFSLALFLRSPHGHPRDIHSSRAVRFGIDAAADIGEGGKKIGRHDGKLCPRRGERRHGLTDLLRRPRMDASTRRVSFLRFSPARPLPATLSDRNPRPSS